ncbi:4-hydroxy-tetrahydrodipicolinate synthase [Kribbella sp. NPDC051620]|uniref:4-hydroxy-tetrahydrodipicolinate synthase n=1 Tax=Kribbella sp. NPDC051620 TaxID=3364120 RepID=UPI00379114C3
MTAADLFGANLVAMVTPMNPDGSISTEGVTSLVDHLITTGADGLVVAGTTGESPTLTDAETTQLIKAVATQATGRAKVVAGIGTYDTASSIRRAQEAEAAGADALLLVTPYYSKPTQAGVIAHCRAVAHATTLPVMLYDVPHRTGLALDPATITELATHPRIQAIKDAKGDLAEAMTVMATTDLAYYCGIDDLNLPYLAAGATGLVSVTGNLTATPNADLIQAIRTGDLDTARAIHVSQIPVTAALTTASQGAANSKAALAELGIIPHPSVRLPLVEGQPGSILALAV